MKRTFTGDATDVFHPSLSFHREVLIVQEWNAIRREFLAVLQSLSKQADDHGLSKAPFFWKEPKKLWRHSQEALGKWILSQVARIDKDDLKGTRQNNAKASPPGEESVMGVHTLKEKTSPNRSGECLFFFPTQRWKIRVEPTSNSSGPNEEGNGGSYASYDSQLLRDLSIKSSAIDNEEHARLLEQAILSFDLLRRCTVAEERVNEKMKTVTPSTALVPLIRVLEEGSAERSLSQNRMKDVVIEITAAAPPPIVDPSAGPSCRSNRISHSKTPPRTRYPVVSITKASLEKLRRSYSHFGKTEDQQRYGLDSATRKEERHPLLLSSEECFLRRAAVVALRYEGGLATGSLQLCADTALKQHLHACGYHVVDLCASPINAYCGVPKKGMFRCDQRAGVVSETPSATGNLDRTREEIPNRFCSAFLDTDYFFGSLGSALHVNPFEIYETCCAKERVRTDEENPDDTPPSLLLTYDVPYDEDLCEQLFLKLESDLLLTPSRPDHSAVVIDYILVLPLWWRIPIHIEKSVFFRSTVHLVSVDETGHVIVPNTTSSSAAFREAAKEAETVIASRSSMLHDGVQIPYTWPERLAAVSQPFVCWDAVFLDESYQYFCTATNQWLRGVTATEVIALQTKRSNGRLSRALISFYGQDAVPNTPLD